MVRPVRRRLTPRKPVEAPDPEPPGPERPHDRFLRLEPDRATREWTRYEGTAQRDLFRDLRARFLGRHRGSGSWSLDVGAGPGRFTGQVGTPGSRHVALDLSRKMLERSVGEERGEGTPARSDRVVGDGLHPPFEDGRFGTVAVLGNTLGFEGDAGPALLVAAERLVGPGGILIVEIAPGAGERSRYLGRLPAGAVRRLVAAPAGAVAPRVQREGYAAEPVRHRSTTFRRWTVAELRRRWESTAWAVRETMAVAPALGADPERLSAVAADPKAWSRLTELEELLGREPERWRRAAAVLVAARRGPVLGAR